ncbi:peptidase [Rhizobium sp. Leaf384]|uniref:prolyl oligopeptidase family serine peptidase n=1 Tax=unclassified Rhizobium TaxID=2613769 RepID=UPI000714630C|nr:MULTISPECIES: prolyl oligopeptidase family serine peptidase [unclassified Rhizobium]KQS80491.1 peptidase [Rhizobium sp. Leaf384]KQS86541.1 peptidase [Rhizobium sp. Leaf383]
MHLYLETDDDARTRDFVAQENARSDAALRTEAFAADAAAFKAMMEREDRLIHFARRGDWLTTFRKTAGHPMGVWQRLPADQAPVPEAPWETMFDLDAYNAAEGRTWIWRGAVTCPWDPSRVLLSLSDGGSDLRVFREFDCTRFTFVEDGFSTPLARSHATWESLDHILYFGSIDRASSTQSSWPRVGRRIARGQDVAAAVPVFAADDNDVTGYATVYGPQMAGLSGNDRLSIFTAVHTIGTASHVVSRNAGPPVPLDIPRESDASFNHQFCLWRAKKDERVPSGALVLQALPVDMGGDHPPAAPRVLFTPSGRRFCTNFMLLRDWCVFTVADNMTPRLFLLDLRHAGAEPVAFPLPDGLETLSYHPLYSDLHLGDDTLIVSGQGFLQPPTLYRLDLSDRSKSFWLQPVAASPAYFDASGMSSLLLEATSEDGTRVPYRLVLPATFEKGALPVLLYGYGGFEVPLQPGYSGIIGRWLEQGGAYVQAYIRGGGEFGADWHRAAKRDGRHRAFADFAAIARDLVARGYTKPRHIACNGGSNGGLLTGVMLTRYPACFGAVWCQVPVLDMLRFHTFPAGRAWMDEYGDPDVAQDREAMLAYSPLQAARPSSEVAYPPIYIESSSNDDRVHPSHARRFAARLRELGHDPLFHEFTSGGHGGEGDTSASAARIATGYSFLRQTIMAPEA